MFQRTLFGAAINRNRRAAQAALPFTSYVDSGRRGTMDANWLTDVLAGCRNAGYFSPHLHLVQEQWDRGSSVTSAVVSLVCSFSLRTIGLAMRDAASGHGPRPFPSPAQPTLALPSPRPMLALPCPASPADRARKLTEGGISQRDAARRMGLPITSFRRLLGRVK
jgi:hypothetical protein